MDFEEKVEGACSTILKTDPENWGLRNKALLQIIALVSSHQSEPPERLNEIFTSNLFRTLKEPVKNMVGWVLFSFELDSRQNHN